MFQKKYSKIIIGILLVLGFWLTLQAAGAVDLQVKIPGQPDAGKDLAHYVAAWYTFGVSAISIIAVVMIMWGGFEWITAAGSATLIGQAKGRIMNAIVGIILILTSYGLLYLINPALVELRMPAIEKINKQDIKTERVFSWQNIDNCSKLESLNYDDSFCSNIAGTKPEANYRCCGKLVEKCANENESCSIGSTGKVETKCCGTNLACIGNFCTKKSKQSIGESCVSLYDCDYDLTCQNGKCIDFIQSGCLKYTESCYDEPGDKKKCCDERLQCIFKPFKGYKCIPE